MKKWLLDTNAVIALVARRSEPFLRKVEASKPGALAIPSIVAHELYFGAYRSQKIEFDLETLRLLLPISKSSTSTGRTRERLARSGRNWRGAAHRSVPMTS